MDKYKCHKVVEAFKIAKIEDRRLGATLITQTLHSSDGDEVKVDLPFIKRNSPSVGDYYVKYKDGFASISPAKAFEEGYVPLADEIDIHENIDRVDQASIMANLAYNLVSDPSQAPDEVTVRCGGKVVGRIINIGGGSIDKPDITFTKTPDYKDKDLSVADLALAEDEVACTTDKNVIAAINVLCGAAYANSKHKGFHDEPRQPGTAIALMHSELSEALEALRAKGRPPESTKIPGFLNIEEELADVLIRVFDFCGQYNYRLGEAIIAKMEHNSNRPHKHGKTF